MLILIFHIFVFQPKGLALRIAFKTIEVLEQSCDAFEVLGIDRYMYAYGLYVLPEYRGQRIGLEILKAR